MAGDISMTLGRGVVLKSATAGMYLPLVSLERAASSAMSTPSEDSVAVVMADPLAEKLALYEVAISQHAAALDKAYLDGEEAGKIVAEEMFDQSRKEALSMLEKAFSTALEDLKLALSGFEALSLQVALEALTVLTDNPETHHKILAATIKKQLSALDARSIVSVTVSRSDFPDSRELAELETKLGAPTNTLRLCGEMDSGNSHIALSIGAVEIDLKRSWREIAEMLSASASNDVVS
jgi:hypothetical protein